MALPKIGELRHRIIIEVLTNTTDLQGGQSTTWATYANAYALINPVSASEIQFATKIQYRRTHKCVIRQRSDLTFTTAMRVNFDSRFFQIKGIRKVDEQDFYLMLDLEEGVGT